jgi:3-phenylpropionate/trans-cinnamate dioxygenase ferredoxin subunit
MSEWVKATRVSEIPEGQMKAVEVGYHNLVICHTSDGFYALDNECSHDSAPISDGELKGKEMVCARHGARFNVEDGAVTAPPAVVGIDSYEVKIDGDLIYVRVD